MTDANNAKVWSREQEMFIDWLARPKPERVPKTQKALAVQIGVDEGTLSDWKRLAGWHDAVNTLSREYVKHDVPDVLAVVRSRAKKGELAYVNMVLAMAGMAVDVEAAGKGPGQIKAYVSVSPDDWSGSA